MISWRYRKSFFENELLKRDPYSAKEIYILRSPCRSCFSVSFEEYRSLFCKKNTHTYTHAHTYTNTHTHTYRYTAAHPYAHAHPHTYAYMYIYVYTICICLSGGQISSGQIGEGVEPEEQHAAAANWLKVLLIGSQFIHTHTHTHTHTQKDIHVYVLTYSAAAQHSDTATCIVSILWGHGGNLERFVGSLNFQVFVGKEPYFCRPLLQKRPDNSGSLHIVQVATPHRSWRWPFPWHTDEHRDRAVEKWTVHKFEFEKLCSKFYYIQNANTFLVSKKSLYSICVYVCVFVRRECICARVCVGGGGREREREREREYVCVSLSGSIALARSRSHLSPPPLIPLRFLFLFRLLLRLSLPQSIGTNENSSTLVRKEGLNNITTAPYLMQWAPNTEYKKNPISHETSPK